MQIDFWFPNFGLQVAKLQIFNLEWFLSQKIWTIGFWTKFSKFDNVIQKYDNVTKTFLSSTNTTPNFKSIAVSDDDILGVDQMVHHRIFGALKSLGRTGLSSQRVKEGNNGWNGWKMSLNCFRVPVCLLWRSFPECVD